MVRIPAGTPTGPMVLLESLASSLVNALRQLGACHSGGPSSLPLGFGLA